MFELPAQARAAVPGGGSGVGIGRLMTSDSLGPSVNTGASPRSSLDRIVEHPRHTTSSSGGSGSTLLGPPSNNGRVSVDTSEQTLVPESAEAPPESALDQLKESLGFGRHEEESGSWRGEKKMAASELGALGTAHERGPEQRSTVSKVTDAIGLGGVTGGASSELAQLGTSHEESRDPVTGDEAEDKGLPRLSSYERKQAAREEQGDLTPVRQLSAAEHLMVEPVVTYEYDVPITPKPLISPSPVSVLDRETLKEPETETVYSDEQTKIWGAVGTGAAGGAGVGAALGVGAAAAALAAPAVAAVAAGMVALYSQ